MASTASTTTSAQVLAAGSNRRVILCNTDANACYVLVGAGTASATNMSFSLAQNENAAFDCDEQINAVWAADGSGYLFVTAISKG